MTVSPQDVARERKLMLDKLFQDFDQGMDEKVADAQKAGDAERVKKLRQEKEDGHAQLLDQFFTQQRLTPGEFDQLLQINTYLRKIAEPLLKDKITDEMLQRRFGAKYGEKVKVRTSSSPARPMRWPPRAASRRGQRADQPAGGLRADGQGVREARLGRQQEPTDRRARRDAGVHAKGRAVPAELQGGAFALKEKGQVSDLVQDGTNFHLILLEDRIQPKAVKFEDVRGLYDELTRSTWR